MRGHLLTFGLAAVLTFQWTRVSSAADPTAVTGEPLPPPVRPVDAGRPDVVGSPEAVPLPSRIAEAVVADAAVPPALRTSALTVLRQHPGESRWTGRAGQDLFAIVVEPLSTGAERDRAVPVVLSVANARALRELLFAGSVHGYAAVGLTDLTTLRLALAEASGRMDVGGTGNGVSRRAVVVGNSVVAYAFANQGSLEAAVLAPTNTETVRAAYRDTMHRQARELMKAGNWSDAILLWQHLHERKLVSEQLYLDAARCFAALGQREDVLRVVREAIAAFSDVGAERFFEEAGDIALELKTPAADAVAIDAYSLASRQLLNGKRPPDGSRPASGPAPR